MAATNTKREYGNREARSERVTARVTPTTRDALEARAMDDDCEVSDVVRRALTAYLTTAAKTTTRRVRK